MKKLFSIILLLFSLQFVYAKPINIFLVTGGHSYDTIQFFQMFDSLEGVEYEHFIQPEANTLIAEGGMGKYDVLVFYDMWQTISESEKEAYIKLTKSGKPFLFLHHSLASYQNWEMFESLLGGKYVERKVNIPESELSTYKHDVWIDVEVLNSKHPVTEGLDDFRIFDEVYGNFKISENVIPLLQTDHTESTPVIGWENTFNISKIVYLQPGHDHRSYVSEDLRKLISRSIKYLAKSNK